MKSSLFPPGVVVHRCHSNGYSLDTVKPRIPYLVTATIWVITTAWLTSTALIKHSAHEHHRQRNAVSAPVFSNGFGYVGVHKLGSRLAPLC
jgi:hypothetical protein